MNLAILTGSENAVPTPNGETRDDPAILTARLTARFLEALSEFALRVPSQVDLAILFHQDTGGPSSSSEPILVVGHLPASDGSSLPSRKHPVEIQGQFLGTAIIVSQPPPAAVALLGEFLVDQAIRTAEWKQVEEDLLQDLCESHERLGALDETQVRPFSDTASHLRVIVERAAAITAGLQAILWAEVENQLVAKVHPPELALTPRDPKRGLLGAALNSHQPVVCKSHRVVASSRDAEEIEFAAAQAVLVVPVQTARGQRVVLAFWHDQEVIPFGTAVIKHAQALAHQAAMILENDRLFSESIEAARESERFNQQLDIGSRIQQTLLISATPKNFPGLSIGALALPSQKVDGDFIEYIPQTSACLDLIIGDVMGKGIPAALTGAATKSEFHRALGQLMALDNSRLPRPADVVNAAHRRIVDQLIELDSYITLSYARIDLTRRLLTLVDCGHTGIIHRSASNGSIRVLKGDNVPFGFSPREVYNEVTVELEKGDLLVFFSDGLTEARHPIQGLYGQERFQEWIAHHANLEPNDLVKAIEREIRGYSGENLQDDLTCVAIRILEWVDGEGRDTPAPFRVASWDEVGGDRTSSERIPNARALVHHFESVSPDDPPPLPRPNSLKQLAAALGGVPDTPPPAWAASPPTVSYEATLPSHYHQLKKVRQLVRDAGAAVHALSGSGSSWDPFRLHEVEIAVNEATTNIIRHAYREATDRHFRIRVDAQPDQVVVRLTDAGDGFQPETVPMPALDGHQIGGMGLYIMRSYLDDLHYERSPEGLNTVVLTRRAMTLPPNDHEF